MLVLYTDFGLSGPYVGQMKLAIRRQAPQLPIVDLMHDAPVFDSRASAYLLAALSADLPRDCAVVGVVDPGVGSSRAGLFLRADCRWYIGPDNGLFERVVASAEQVQCWRITWQPERLSDSFHGRDLFAPLAARLFLGDDPAQLGEAVEYPWRHWPEQWPYIIYIDAYGNAVTGIQAGTLSRTVRLHVGTQALEKARTFSDVPPGRGFWYENSSGLVEIAVNQGRADRQLGLKIGSPMTVQN